MKLSVMQFTFYGLLANGDVSVKQLADEYCAAGASAIEPMTYGIEHDPKLWQEQDAAFKDHGMVYDCYDVGINLIDDGTPVGMRKALDEVKQQAAVAAEKLHSPLLMIYGTAPAPGMSNEDGRKFYGEQLAKAAEIARPFGITVCIEDFGVTPYFTAASEHCKQVLDVAGDAVKFNFDNGNFIYGGDTPRKAFDLLEDRTCHVHLKDFVTYRDDSVKNATRSVNGDLFRDIPHGQGIADVEWTIKSFLKRGYDGYFSLEVFSNNTYADTLHAFRFAKSFE